MVNIIDISKNYAIKCHESTNHYYDGKSYQIHLEMVFNIAKKFIHLIPTKHQENVLSACWCHDVIEDCRQNYNDVKKETNEEIAELVYALSNEKGKNRKERANEKYYEGIRNTPYAPFVKICDRIANYEYSKQQGNNRMTKIYDEEMEDFNKQLYNPKYDIMFFYLKLNNN